MSPSVESVDAVVELGDIAAQRLYLLYGSPCTTFKSRRKEIRHLTSHTSGGRRPYGGRAAISRAGQPAPQLRGLGRRTGSSVFAQSCEKSMNAQMRRLTAVYSLL